MTWSTSRSARAIALAAMLTCAASVTAAVGRADAVWVVDPDEAGPNVPPVGRSLFDFLVTRQVDGRTVYDVPYPFTELQRVIAARLGRTPETAFKRTLIPIGRSLQRFAAEPDFFAAPRVIVAVDQDAANGTDNAPLLRDRLFLGFQPRSQTIEVISYNEAAGRFEFQLVHDYGPDRTPQVLYAERRICTQCHQNHAPIFSRPLWNETTASPLVTARLRAERPEFDGVPAEAGVDPSDAIDSATDRANELSLFQKIWREGCGDDVDGINCRAAGFLAALQYGLAGNRLGDGSTARFRGRFAEVVTANLNRIWPGGLALSNPDIPDRDPLADLPPGFSAFADLVEPDGVFDPSTRRAPAVIWPATDRANDEIDAIVVGLSRFLSAGDLRRLDADLRRLARDASRTLLEAACHVRVAGEAELRIRCQGGGEGSNQVTIAGHVTAAGTGTIRQLAISGRDQLVNLDVADTMRQIDGATWRLSLTLVERGAGLGARLSDGTAISKATLTAPRNSAADSEFEARLSVELTDDFAVVVAAVERMRDDALAGRDDAFAAKAFRRARLMAALYGALGLPDEPRCCIESALLPPVETE